MMRLEDGGHEATSCDGATAKLIQHEVSERQSLPPGYEQEVLAILSGQNEGLTTMWSPLTPNLYSLLPFRHASVVRHHL